MTNSSPPLCAAPAAPVAAAVARDPAAPAPRQVAVVDSNPVEAAWICSALLGLPGVRLHRYAEAGEFLVRLGAGWRPDLTLVDYRMPGLDGLQVGAALAGLGHAAAAPWMLMTGRIDDDADQRAREIGAADVLYKPLQAEPLRNRVRRALSSPHPAATPAKDCPSACGDADEAVLLEVLVRLARLRDDVTGTHLERMALYCVQIALSLEAPAHFVEDIRRAAPMHDIGKIGVPDHILNKPGRLEPHEREVMRRHPGFGAAVLQGGRSTAMAMAGRIALCHHERFDGQGYPQGLAGAAIPLEARIVAVADVFDALTTERPYKPAWTLEAAAQHIRDGAGAHFDPEVVAAFERALPQMARLLAELAQRGHEQTPLQEAARGVAAA